MSETKVCMGACGAEKTLGEFSKNGKGRGLRPYCKDCCNESARKNRIENGDHCREAKRKYRAKNGARELEMSRKMHKKNPGPRRESTRRWSLKNPEKRRALLKKWREDHKDERREYDQKYKDDYPRVVRAHRLVCRAIAAGELERATTCEGGGCESSESIQAHHDDYLKPLDVRWMCVSCHKKWHSANGPGLNREGAIPTC